MPNKVPLLQPEWDKFVNAWDEAAYQVLYKHYYHYLSYVGLKRGFATTLVKDCINDLFLYLWENTSRLRAVNDYHNYLVTIFLNKIMRREHFAIDAAVELTLATELLTEPSVEAAYIQAQAQMRLREQLASYLDNLPARQRLVIYQKFYLGLSYTEVAAANQLSINTVYNTVYQALSKLKSQLGSSAADLLSLAIIASMYGLSRL